MPRRKKQKRDHFSITKIDQPVVVFITPARKGLARLAEGFNPAPPIGKVI